MSPDPSLPTTPPATPAARGSQFTKASWFILLGGLFLTAVAYQLAYIYRRPGDWMPGISQLVIGVAATAVCSFLCALTALLRREKRGWMALPPLIAGLGTILYFAWNVLSK